MSQPHVFTNTIKLAVRFKAQVYFPHFTSSRAQLSVQIFQSVVHLLVLIDVFKLLFSITRTCAIMCADISELCGRQLCSWWKFRSTSSSLHGPAGGTFGAPLPPQALGIILNSADMWSSFSGGPSILHSKRGMFLYESHIHTRNLHLLKCFIIRLAFGLLQPITSFLYCGKAMVQILQIRHYGNVCELVCKIDRGLKLSHRELLTSLC